MRPQRLQTRWRDSAVHFYTLSIGSASSPTGPSPSLLFPTLYILWGSSACSSFFLSSLGISFSLHLLRILFHVVQRKSPVHVFIERPKAPSIESLIHVCLLLVQHFGVVTYSKQLSSSSSSSFFSFLILYKCRSILYWVMHDGLSRDFLNSHSVPRAKETQRSAPTVAQRHHQTKFHSPSRCPAPLPHQAPSHPPPGDRREGTNKTCLFFFFIFLREIILKSIAQAKEEEPLSISPQGIGFFPFYLKKKNNQQTYNRLSIYIYTDKVLNLTAGGFIDGCSQLAPSTSGDATISLTIDWKQGVDLYMISPLSLSLSLSLYTYIYWRER